VVEKVPMRKTMKIVIATYEELDGACEAIVLA
jgi:hypothetical protein